MSRNWGVFLLATCADVVIAMFWPGPIDGATILTAIGVDVAILLGAAVGPFVAAHRSIDLLQADALAGAPICYWPTLQVRRDQAILDVATKAQVQL